MARKGENIFKRKDGRWEARYVKGYELSGKIKYGFCYGKSYKEAKQKVTQIKADLVKAVPLTPLVKNRHRLAFFCLEWQQTQKNQIKESSYVRYVSILQCHIIPKLGACYPQGIDNPTIEAFKQELLDEGLSVQSVKSILMVLHSVLKYAAEHCPGSFPIIEVRYPKDMKRETRVLTIEEQKRLVFYLWQDLDTCKFGILLALSTGLRIGELCALKWENISLRNKTLRIDCTMQRISDSDHEGNGKTKILIGTPKTDTSIRTIPLTDQLAELCREMDPHCSAAFVLTGTETFMEPRKLQRHLKKYVRECNLQDVHFHTLRHTFATRCVENGFELKSLSEILGHAKTSTTLDRYVHSSLEVKRDNMEKLALEEENVLY